MGSSALRRRASVVLPLPDSPPTSTTFAVAICSCRGTGEAQQRPAHTVVSGRSRLSQRTFLGNRLLSLLSCSETALLLHAVHQFIMAASSQLRVISGADVERLLSVRDAIAINAEAFTAMARGECDVPARLLLAVPEHDGGTLFKPCRFSSGRGLGLKVVSVRPRNAAQQLPTVPAVILLHDDATGLPLCLMEATYLTGLRTAAGSAVATDRLAAASASRLVVFGAGLQARLHVLAIACVRPITDVTIVNRSRERAEQLVAELREALPDVSSTPVTFSVLRLGEDGDGDKEALQNAVRSADVIVTATNSSTPLFPGEWLRDGTHINAVGAYQPTTCEIDEACARRCRIILDSEAAMSVGDIHGLRENVAGTLGQLLESPATLSAQTAALPCTLFKSVGTAAQDILTAQAVYERSVAASVGSVVPL
eukprot:m.197846 g.197846  ORF g.197846 m.197846 type:complete len:425 (+) comp17671_c1_seq1:1187-2461(+)